jgi:hypothetical protein
MNLTPPKNRIEINKRMIGKTVNVLCKTGINWIGEITDVKNEETFTVTNTDGDSFNVDIWDIRSMS